MTPPAAVLMALRAHPPLYAAVAGTRLDAGVSVAEVNLKLIWEVVSQIKVGKHGSNWCWKPAIWRA